MRPQKRMQRMRELVQRLQMLVESEKIPIAVLLSACAPIVKGSLQTFKNRACLCEYTKRCETSVLMFVRCTAKIWIAFGRV